MRLYSPPNTEPFRTIAITFLEKANINWLDLALDSNLPVETDIANAIRFLDAVAIALFGEPYKNFFPLQHNNVALEHPSPTQNIGCIGHKLQVFLLAPATIYDIVVR